MLRDAATADALAEAMVKIQLTLFSLFAVNENWMLDD